MKAPFMNTEFSFCLKRSVRYQWDKREMKGGFHLMRVTDSASGAEEAEAAFRMLETVPVSNKGPFLRRLWRARGLLLLLQCILITNRGQNISHKDDENHSTWSLKELCVPSRRS